MTEPQPPEEQPQSRRKYDQAQYDMLLRCSGNGTEGIAEWNEWRRKNRDTPVHLEGADLVRAHLKGADLTDAHLESAVLIGARLDGAILIEARLERANLRVAHLEGADLTEAHLEDANLRRTYLTRADLWGTYLMRADLRIAHLEGATLWEARLAGAILEQAHLEGTYFRETHLEGVKARFAVVDGSTLIDTPYVDRETDFTGVGLGAARVAPGLKQLLEGNIRQKRWEAWYRERPRWKRTPVEWFWQLSDYGLSTGRIILWFFLLAWAFSVLYCAWPAACRLLDLPCDPDLVADLPTDPETTDLSWPAIRIRALYFSIVTMTTLGFGDMHANKYSIPGHVVLAIQVLLGYVMLGVLVTRFAVLFAGAGPAQKPKP